MVVVQPFETEEEVISKSNDTVYGLHATIFTRDLSRAYRFIKAFEAGMVAVDIAVKSMRSHTTYHLGVGSNLALEENLEKLGWNLTMRPRL